MLLAIVMLAALTANDYKMSSPFKAQSRTAYPSSAETAQKVLHHQDIGYLAEAAEVLACCRGLWYYKGSGDYWSSDLGWTLDYYPRKEAVEDAARKVYNGAKPSTREFGDSVSCDWVKDSCGVDTSKVLDSFSMPSSIRSYLTNYSRPSWTGGTPDNCNTIANGAKAFPNSEELNKVYAVANECVKNNKLLFYGYLNNVYSTGQIVREGHGVDYLDSVIITSSGQTRPDGWHYIEDYREAVICNTNTPPSYGVMVADYNSWFVKNGEWCSESSGGLGESVDVYRSGQADKNETDYYRWKGEAPITLTLMPTNLTSDVASYTIDAYAVIQVSAYEDGTGWVSCRTDNDAWNCPAYDKSLGKIGGQQTKYYVMPITLTESGVAPAGRPDAGYKTFTIGGLAGIDDMNWVLDKLGYQKFRWGWMRTAYWSWDEWKEAGVPYDAAERVPSRTTIGGSWCVEMKQYQTIHTELQIRLYAIFGFIKFTPKYKY